MVFEWDKEKSEANLKNYGIDFKLPGKSGWMKTGSRSRHLSDRIKMDCDRCHRKQDVDCHIYHQG